MSDPGGIEVRIARPGDVEGIVALVGDRIGQEDGPEARLTLEDPGFGPEGWTVAVAENRVVSTLGLFPISTRIGTIAVRSAAIEFVATASEFEGRGLVRRQLELAHRLSCARGDLIVWMVGIPFFYRQFGYEYAVTTPETIELAAPLSNVATDLSFREALLADIDDIMALQGHMAASAMTVAAHDPLLWSWLIQSPVYRVVLAERDGEPVGMMRIYNDDGTSLVFDVAAGDPTTFRSLAAEACGTSGKAILAMRPGLKDLASEYCERELDGYAYYVRVLDPAALLEKLRPELNLRLSDSHLDPEDGELLLSFYRQSVRFKMAKGRLGSMTKGGSVQAPVSQGGSGIPPDLIAHLILGPLGALELEQRHADVLLGKQRELMDVLFPPQTVDVQSWVWP